MVKTAWVQEKNKVYFHFGSNKVYMNVPTNYKLKDTRQELLDLAEYFLTFRLGHNRVVDGLEVPKFMHNDSYVFSDKKIDDYDKIGLSYSNGVDSGACLLMMPPDKTIPIYLYRDYIHGATHVKESVYGQGYNTNAVRGIKMIKNTDLPTPHIVHTNFETMRTFKWPAKTPGFSCGIGYVSVLLLLADYYKFNTIALGVILESAYMGTGHRFIDVQDKTKGRSGLFNYRALFAKVGISLVYPVGGCSEVITTKIVNNSVLKTICSSCQIRLPPGKVNCMKCYKCFRKGGFAGKLLINPKIERLLKQYPLRSAVSSAYSIQKCRYNTPYTKKYLKLDVSYLERYYATYLDPESGTVTSLVTPELGKYLKEKFTELKIDPMTPKDVANFVNSAKYFNNPAKRNHNLF